MSLTATLLPIAIFLFILTAFFILSGKQIKSLSTKYLIFVFFFLYPLTAAFIPTITVMGISFSAERLYLLGPVLFLGGILHKNSFRIKVSLAAKYFFFYSVYLMLMSLIKGFFAPSEVLFYVFPFLFLLLIENITYAEKDLVFFEKVVMSLIVINFLVGFFQMFYDPYFYTGIGSSARLSAGAAGHFRTRGVFTFGTHEWGIGAGYLSAIMLFLNYERGSWIRYLLTGVAFFSVAITFTRYVWLMALIALWIYLFYKHRKQILPLGLLFGFILAITILAFFDTIRESPVYQERVLSDTYLSRWDALGFYFKQYFGENIIFGYGQWSAFFWSLEESGHSTVHQGFLDIFFRGGIIGLWLYAKFLHAVYIRGKRIAAGTTNPLFFTFIVIFVLINCTAGFIVLQYYGYYIMFFYLSLYEAVKVNASKGKRPALLQGNGITYV